jgi:hypothetical protein
LVFGNLAICSATEEVEVTKRNDTIAAAQDLEGEKNLARALNRYVGWSKMGWREISLEKLPIYYELDFVIVKDHRTIEAWMEVKERKAFYDPWIFPLSKWLTCKKFSEESGKPVYVVQSYPKGNNIVTIALEVTSDLQPTVIWAGRKDRGDWQDMAPHVELPNNWFTIIEETHLDTN